MTVQELKDLEVYYTTEGLGYGELIGVIKLDIGYFVVNEKLTISDSQLYQVIYDLDEDHFKKVGNFAALDIYEDLEPLFKLILK